MQTKNPFLDEIAKLTTAAAGLAQAAGEEAKTQFRSQADRFVAEMDLVRRDDLDALKAEIAALRAEQFAGQARRQTRPEGQTGQEGRVGLAPGKNPLTPAGLSATVRRCTAASTAAGASQGGAGRIRLAKAYRRQLGKLAGKQPDSRCHARSIEALCMPLGCRHVGR
eukprot:gene63762-87207_t